MGPSPEHGEPRGGVGVSRGGATTRGSRRSRPPGRLLRPLHPPPTRDAHAPPPGARAPPRPAHRGCAPDKKTGRGRLGGVVSLARARTALARRRRRRGGHLTRDRRRGRLGRGRPHPTRTPSRRAPRGLPRGEDAGVRRDALVRVTRAHRRRVSELQIPVSRGTGERRAGGGDTSRKALSAPGAGGLAAGSRAIISRTPRRTKDGPTRWKPPPPPAIVEEARTPEDATPRNTDCAPTRYDKSRRCADSTRLSWRT